MANMVIYGGTFNPIHNGHICICHYVLDELNFDKVLLIPSAAPPHKEAPELAASDDRLTMCRLAAEDLRDTEVLDWELLRGGLSYSIDTIQYLVKKYTGNRLFFLMGSDMFLTFREWRDWQGIGKLVTLLVASRETDDMKQLEVQQISLADDGVASRILKNPITPLSSTELRGLLSKNKGYELLPPKVARYIRTEGLYGCGYNIAKLRNTVKPLLTDERYYHSLCVERQAVHLAQLYEADENKAAAAGILHDICKNMAAADLLQMINNSDTIYDIDFEAQPQLLHGYAGALYIQKILGINDNDILNAVRYHTTARAGMSLMERIIYLADLTSEERGYPDVTVMRSLADTSQEEAMLYALTYITKDLTGRGLTVCEISKRALVEYQSISNKNKSLTIKMEEKK